MKYIVLSADVVAKAFSSKAGASNRLLREVAEGRLVPLLSSPLFLEYETTLKQAEQRLAHGLTLDDIDGALSAVARAAEPVDVTFLWRPQMKDPNDELVLEAAVSGSAEAIVTLNPDKFSAIATLFGIAVLTPQDYMKMIDA